MRPITYKNSIFKPEDTNLVSETPRLLKINIGFRMLHNYILL